MTERQTDVSFELGAIKNALDTITRTLSENRLADATYRTDIRREMGEQSTKINNIVTEVTLAKRDITDMKPKVDSLNERAAMSKGATNLALILSKGAHVISAGLGAIIAVLLERWLRGPHP